MKPGTRPKPTKQKELEGNPGKRPLNENEPQPDAGDVKCPLFLSANAKKEWQRIAPELERIGVFTMIDQGALAACCQLYGRWIELEKDIKAEGIMVDIPKYSREGDIIGHESKINPKVTEARQTLIQYRGYCAEFGLTPSSRSRIVVPDSGGGEEDILD
jgi:P27 family predicted phage terminase small subunit